MARDHIVHFFLEPFGLAGAPFPCVAPRMIDNGRISEPVFVGPRTPPFGKGVSWSMLGMVVQIREKPDLALVAKLLHIVTKSKGDKIGVER